MLERFILVSYGVENVFFIDEGFWGGCGGC